MAKSPTRQPAVGIYRTDLLLPSETFIASQARCLADYRPVFMAESVAPGFAYPALSVSRGQYARWRRLLFRVTGAPWLLGRPSAFADMALVHAHFGPDGLTALPLARALDVPLIVTLHGYDATMAREALARVGSATRRFVRREATLQEGADRFIAVSRFIAGRMAELGYPAERTLVHHIGVDTELFAPSPQPAPHPRPGRRYVLCIGRLVPKKGMDVLIEAFAAIAARHPDVDLLIAGEGPERARISAKVASEGLEPRVQLLGMVAPDAIVGLLAGAEAFALASRTAPNGDSEGLPIAVLEAAASGKAVVSTRHAGIPEAIVDGESGLLASEGDAPGLAAALDQVLADDALRHRLGARGRERMCAAFDLRRQTGLLERLYDDVVEARERRGTPMRDAATRVT